MLQTLHHEYFGVLPFGVVFIPVGYPLEVFGYRVRD